MKPVNVKKDWLTVVIDDGDPRDARVAEGGHLVCRVLQYHVEVDVLRVLDVVDDRDADGLRRGDAFKRLQQTESNRLERAAADRLDGAADQLDGAADRLAAPLTG